MKFWLLLFFLVSIHIYADESEKKEWWEYIDGSVKIKFQFKEILNHQFLVKGIWSAESLKILQTMTMLESTNPSWLRGIDPQV